MSLVIHRVRFLKIYRKYINIQSRVKLRKPLILVVNWVSSCLSFLLSASTPTTYIFTAPICTATILVSNLVRQMLSFSISFWDNKISSLCRYHWKRGYGVKADWKTGWKQGDFTDNSNIHIWECYFLTLDSLLMRRECSRKFIYSSFWWWMRMMF
jgi:hypothetical protein